MVTVCLTEVHYFCIYHRVWPWEGLFLEFSIVIGLHKGPTPFPNFCICYWSNLRDTLPFILPLLHPPESIQSPQRWKQYVPPKYWARQFPHSVKNSNDNLQQNNCHKKQSNHITGLDRHWGFQEVQAPRFQDNWHMKVVNLSALHTGHLYLPDNIPSTHFC